MQTAAESAAEWTFETLANRALFGVGRAAQAGDELRRLGAARAMVVGSPGALRRNAALLDGFGGLVVARFEGVAPHCPIETVEAAEALYVRSAADGVLTLGGGSALGVAKNLSVRLGAPSVALPTTYSGSEMTPIYGAKQAGEKRTARKAEAKPGVSLYDPLMTLSLPAGETAGTGMNGLAHCVEALYPATPAPFAAAMAVDGIKAFFEGLPPSIEQPDGIKGRSRALYGAFVGGLLVQLVGIGLHHRLCHILGGRFDVAHGVSNSVVLPYVAAFNAAAIRAAAPGLEDALGAPLGAAIWRLGRRIGAPRDLQSAGVPREAVGALAEETLAHGGANPRPYGVADIAALLQAAWAGEPVGA